MTVRLEPSEDAQKSSPISDGRVSDRASQRQRRRTHLPLRVGGRVDDPARRRTAGTRPFLDPLGRRRLLLPQWDQAEQGDGVDFTEKAYLVETAPGLPSLQLANSLAEQKGGNIEPQLDERRGRLPGGSRRRRRHHRNGHRLAAQHHTGSNNPRARTTWTSSESN